MLGAQLARIFTRKHIRELEAQLIERELVLLVRVRSPEAEAKAARILVEHGAQAAEEPRWNDCGCGEPGPGDFDQRHR